MIFQFVSRGAPRCEDFAGEYTIYVYDRQQAEALRDKLLGYDFPLTEIEHIGLPGFTDRVRPAQGRKPIYSTPEARKDAERASSRARSKKSRDKKKLFAFQARSVRPEPGWCLEGEGDNHAE